MGTDLIPREEVPVDENGAAEFLGVKRQAMANWRCARKGPIYHKIGTRVIYLIEDLKSYRGKRRIVP